MKQLTNDEMRQVLSDWIDDTDASAKTRRNILGLFEAVITRAEAAEAERDALRAQVGGQGWRPVTERPEDGRQVEIMVIRTGDYRNGGYALDDSEVWEGWRPTPPQEAAKEA